MSKNKRPIRNLADILLADTAHSKLTRAERKAIRAADMELARLRARVADLESELAGMSEAWDAANERRRYPS